MSLRDRKDQPGGGRSSAPIVAPSAAAQERLGELGPGRPLEPGVRSRMEASLGHSFANVRIHDDAAGAALAASASADAVTIGDDIAFRRGAYRPGTIAGDALLAHELAHVAQQDPSAPVDATWREDHALEADASSAAASAVASTRGLRGGPKGVGRRGPRGMRLAVCGSRPPLQSLSALTARGGATQKEIDTGLDASARRRDKGLAPASPPALEIAGAMQDVSSDTSTAIRNLDEELTFEFTRNGATDDSKSAAQESYLKQLDDLRAGAEKRMDMELRWHMKFTTGAEVSRGMDIGVVHHPRAWALAELEMIDGILARVPDEYMKNASGRIKEIRRMPPGGNGSDAGAAWIENQQTIEVYDKGLENPDLVAKILIHEIGHSTYKQETMGSFTALPPPEWMKLSDWQMTTRDSMTTDLKITEAEAQGIRAKLGERVGGTHVSFNVGDPWVRSGTRMVVADPYDKASPQQRYFHWDAEKIDQFFSRQARTHPGEDLAETFAIYMLKPEVVEKRAPDKFKYMQAHYKQGLKPGPSLSRCG